MGGAHKGAALRAPKGDATRPTTDRLRETIFNILTHRFPEALEGRALDLFAGTGALGLEALSRGASFALFVEQAAGARGVLRGNIDALGVTGRTRVWRRDATRLGECPVPAFNLLLCDPPYGKGLGEAALSAAAAGGWAAAGAVALLEERSGALPDAIDGWAALDRREVGDTQIGFFGRTG